MGWIVLVFVSQYLAGEIVVRLLWRDCALRVYERVARSLLIGPAVLAAQMMVFSVFGIPFRLVIVLGPWWLAAMALLVRGRGRLAGGPADGAASSPRVAHLLATVVLILGGVLVWIGLRTPIFESDPLNNFAFPARIFETHRSLAGHEIANLKAVGHVEYPPLIALNEALVFMAAGESRLRAVMPFFGLAWVALQLLVVSAAVVRLRVALAVLVSLLVMLVPELYALGTVGLADLRLAASVLLLGLEAEQLLRRPAALGAIRVAVVAACCALTKNEGMVVALTTALLIMAIAGRRAIGWRVAFASVLIIGGAAFGWIAYLVAHGAQTGYWSDESAGLPSPGLIDRFSTAVKGLLSFGLSSQVYSSFFGVLWPAGVIATLIGLLRTDTRRATAAFGIACAVHLGLYGLLLAVIKQPIAWSLTASGLRLFVHLVGWPVLLLVTALSGCAGIPRLARGRRYKG